jgi:hypothetical protein
MHFVKGTDLVLNGVTDMWGFGKPDRGHSTEQVEDPPLPSDVENEFASLEKEVGKRSGP